MDSPNDVFCSPEPAFYSFCGYALRLKRSDQAMLSYLAAQIESDPGKLLSHIRRIVMAIDLQEANETFGALVDLFIAKKADPFMNVRTNLLQRAAALLSAEQQNYLLGHLANGIEADAPLPFVSPCSRLSLGILGMTPSALRNE
ncbi:MAG: hypothetical protein Q4A11_05770 [Brachymonas sp.]|nr:hypothetical protein [Brachymonas sp.]